MYLKKKSSLGCWGFFLQWFLFSGGFWSILGCIAKAFGPEGIFLIAANWSVEELRVTRKKSSKLCLVELLTFLAVFQFLLTISKVRESANESRKSINEGENKNWSTRAKKSATGAEKSKGSKGLKVTRFFKFYHIMRNTSTGKYKNFRTRCIWRRIYKA